MSCLVFLLEEPSAKELLELVLPKIVAPEIEYHCIVFEGKTDLRRRLVRKIREWKTPNTQFIVMQDQDGFNCIELKRELKQMCVEAGRPDTMVRIACHELESFYLGDLEAVEVGLHLTGVKRLQSKRKFLNPDLLANPSEELKKLSRGSYQKLKWARNITPHLNLDGTSCSHSFNVLLQGIHKVSSSFPTP